MVKYFVDRLCVNSDFSKKHLSNHLKLNVDLSRGEGFGAY